MRRNQPGRSRCPPRSYSYPLTTTAASGIEPRRQPEPARPRPGRGFPVWRNGQAVEPAHVPAAVTAAPIWCQQRASRCWLIGRAEHGTYCKIVIIWRLSALDLVARNILDTAPQFCGLKTYERYSRQMPLQTNCAIFEDRREPRRRVRRMFKPNSRDRCSHGSRLVRLFSPPPASPTRGA